VRMGGTAARSLSMTDTGSVPQDIASITHFGSTAHPAANN
jgi:hypothetical protein